ncbi:iron-containing alcohol dehydrogenase [Denitrificimonas sp. JX-1]|uniref:Iron-containing alcohol dehydrogenase n=1 Tax=Denitrificimonas halotolerans TaxID=3098930 RepID=A0ABU5GPE5_9GAMM|nr:iron-containing alcohol dehydrogenase [Denitrificimonas sp. JX-1]MDY7218387.1 iron-containing alcohol dehydrogenase [Denitrificimonas sp. JX-1]
MFNFDFYNPTHISFGQGCIAQLEQFVPAEAKVMVLYGGQSAQRTGTLGEVQRALGTRSVYLFGGIEANPTYETLMQAVHIARAEQIDFLLAVGGGSVIDGTKFVAAAVPYPDEPWNILLTGGRDIQAALPIGTVLTLAATGSEMNNGSVITRSTLQSKLPFHSNFVFPKFSMLDPSKSFTLPERQVANGIVDAFVHVIEQYLTYPVNAPVQDRFAEGLLQTLVEQGPLALSQPDDYDVRANLMWVATLALNGLIGAGVPQDWSTHLIGHELTALYGLDHAQTLAIVLPAMMHERRAAKREKLLQYAERVWGIREGDDEQRIDAVIAQTRDFFEGLGVKTRLSDYELDQSAVEAVLRQLEAHGILDLGEHKDIDLAVSRRVLEDCL